MTSPEQPTLTVSQYTVNALPATARIADWWHFDIHARLTRNGRWVVTDGHTHYDADGEPHVLARAAGDHTRADAIDIATRVATTMRINGETASQAAARILTATTNGAR